MFPKKVFRTEPPSCKRRHRSWGRGARFHGLIPNSRYSRVRKPSAITQGAAVCVRGGQPGQRGTGMGSPAQGTVNQGEGPGPAGQWVGGGLGLCAAVILLAGGLTEGQSTVPTRLGMSKAVRRKDCPS